MRNLSCRSLVATLALVAAGGLAPAAGGDPARQAAAPADTDPIEIEPLDGKTFVGAIGLVGKPRDIADSFVFENGTFVSTECELRCKYPASPYYTRTVGERIEFISETRCPYKDARIVWRGTIEGDRISGTSTWEVRRWYWTLEDRFEFEGRLVDSSSLAASD